MIRLFSLLFSFLPHFSFCLTPLNMFDTLSLFLFFIIFFVSMDDGCEEREEGGLCGLEGD